MFEHITIEPTTTCNVNCLGCSRDIRPSSMSMETFQKILQKLKELGNVKSIIFFWRGEPTLNPHLPEMIAEVAKLGIYTYVSTNTSTLYKEKYANRLLQYLDKLELCVDGYNQETIERYRRGISFDSVLKTLKVVGDIKSKTIREMRVLMFKWNDGQENFYRNMAREYNIDLISFALPFVYLDDMVINENTVKEFLSSNSFHQRYKKTDDNTFIPKLSSLCRYDIMRDPVIAVDGTIFSCCYDRYGEFLLGNIIKDNPEEILNKMKNIQPLMRNRKLSICKKHCYQAGVQIDFREFTGSRLKVLQKLCTSSITNSKNFGTFIFRLKKAGGTLKSIYIHKKPR